MIREDLLEFQYYLDRLSKFMQESYGITGQVQTFWSLLKQVNDYYDEFYKQLDFMHNAPEGEMLDHIGEIFGCQRHFTIPIYNASDSMQIDDYAQIDLDDDDFLTYIKTQVIRQNFDGTRETLQKLYSTAVDGIEKKGLLDLRFFYITENRQSGAVCTIRWDSEGPSENMRLLFENGYLTVESLGIRYRRVIVNFNRFASYAQNAYFSVNLSSAPSDWATAEGKYYSIQDLGPATYDWDPEETYAMKTDNGYLVQANKPTNWETSYSSYRRVSITPKTTEAYVSGAFCYLPPQAQSKYAETECSLLESEPADWPKGGYYFESSESPAPQWDSDKIYAKMTEGGYVIVDHEPSCWAGLGDYSEYAILEKTSGSEAFAPDTYYKGTTIGGVYA